jgi:hypothetical protein
MIADKINANATIMFLFITNLALDDQAEVNKKEGEIKMERWVWESILMFVSEIKALIILSSSPSPLHPRGCSFMAQKGAVMRK